MAQHAVTSKDQPKVTPPVADRPLGPGSVVGSYALDELLGKGAMGEVYRARDLRHERTVAIKIVSAECAAEPGAAERLANEARVNSALTHPGVVAVHELGRYRGHPFIVMEFVEGETLASRLAGGRLAARQALRIATEIAEALAAAHDVGVVHRDLKPQNIMLTADGRPKIVDFGLGTLQCAGADDGTGNRRLQVQGTLGYMAPEQALGLPPDMRADQFAFGAILHEMVSGQRAFPRMHEALTLGDLIDAQPVPLTDNCPDAPPALVAIVERCLQKSPRDRYASTFDLAADLKAAADALRAAGGRTAASRPLLSLKNLARVLASLLT